MVLNLLLCGSLCEIDLNPAVDGRLADFRVEHFHPKSDCSTNHNWALDWQNLLGCCHGGSQKNVVDSSNRFTSPDNSCDVPKEDSNWDGKILNPLHIPAFPPLFHFRRWNGEVSVDDAGCEAAGIAYPQAQRSIELLRLNALRLLA